MRALPPGRRQWRGGRLRGGRRWRCHAVGDDAAAVRTRAGRCTVLEDAGDPGRKDTRVLQHASRSERPQAGEMFVEIGRPVFACKPVNRHGVAGLKPTGKTAQPCFFAGEKIVAVHGEPEELLAACTDVGDVAAHALTARDGAHAGWPVACPLERRRGIAAPPGTGAAIGRPRRDLIGLVLVPALARLYPEVSWRAYAALLHHVSQFVHQQRSSFRHIRRKSAGVKDDVAADRIRQRVDRPRRFRRLCIRVHPHPGKVVAEPGLHIGAGGRVERPPRGAQHFMHDRRRHLLRGPQSRTLQGRHLLRTIAYPLQDSAGLFCLSSSHLSHLPIPPYTACAIRVPRLQGSFPPSSRIVPPGTRGRAPPGARSAESPPAASIRASSPSTAACRSGRSL
ncbi:hypothetical protein ASZ90_009536 [hydrocarbon metagenome]|uniref:Uncharacterized protein n=1 Tax=hydrocarbon metagenome TaxID=938273 RepID=A0A0W8FIM1_9ZZZZ